MLSARKKLQMKQPMKPQMTLTGPPKPMPNCRGALGVSAPCIGKHLDPAPQCCRPRAAGTHVEHAGAQQWLIYGGAVQVAARQVAHSHRACGGVSRLHAAQGNADAAHKRDVALQLLFVPQRGEVLRYGQARSDSAVGVTCHKCDVASSFNNGSKQRAMRGGAPPRPWRRLRRARHHRVRQRASSRRTRGSRELSWRRRSARARAHATRLGSRSAPAARSQEGGAAPGWRYGHGSRELVARSVCRWWTTRRLGRSRK